MFYVAFPVAILIEVSVLERRKLCILRLNFQSPIYVVFVCQELLSQGIFTNTPFRLKYDSYCKGLS